MEKQIDPRHKDISMKILKIGAALMKEGEEKADYTIGSLGNFLIFISSLAYDEKDIDFFGELCSMMTAKKLIKRIDSGKATDTNPSDKLMDEIMKRIRKDMNEDGDSDIK